ncbi:MAG: hypothetical protein FRX49_05696 [Trebouxia sp. A1-2]|nr:MAG: hypothetical protein FRX49_05696 [Trebouxia sp. A1-2]
MPVQTRQASQAASHMVQHRFNVNGSFHTPASGDPRIHGWRHSDTGVQLDHSHLYRNRAAQTTPADAPSTQRRFCIATPVEERMLAELISFEQELSDRCPETSAPIEDPDEYQQDFEAQRESDPALQEAEALAADEARYHQSLLAEEQDIKHKQESFCVHLHYAADVMHDPSIMETMSAAQLSQVQAAAHRLLSVCDDAKDSIQQKEVQHLKQEVHQLQALNRQEKLASDKLLETNRNLNTDSIVYTRNWNAGPWIKKDQT